MPTIATSRRGFVFQAGNPLPSVSYSGVTVTEGQKAAILAKFAETHHPYEIIDITAQVAVIKADRQRILANARRIGQNAGRPVYSKCPITKAAVSVTNNTFDGYDNTGPIYKLADMLNMAECNFKAAHIAQFVQANYNYFSIFPGPWSPADVTVQYTPTAGKLPKPFDVTFMFEGSYLCFGSLFVAGLWQQDIRIWIDDEEIDNWYLGTRAGGVLQNKSQIQTTSLGTGSHIINVNFPNRGTYKVRIAGPITTMGGAAFNSTTAGNFLTVNSKSRVFKPAPRQNIGLLSDSWAEPIYTNTIQSLVANLSHQLNANIWNFAQSGSGFCNPSGSGVNGDRSFPSNLVWDAVGRGPLLDGLIINGSSNDMGYTEAQNIAAMKATFDRARAYRADIPIVWVGLEPQSYFKGVYTLATMKARETALLAVADADPNVVLTIPTCNEEWLTGTGKTTATTNDGNQDFVTGPDGVHLSEYGARYIGKMTGERVKTLANL